LNDAKVVMVLQRIDVCNAKELEDELSEAITSGAKKTGLQLREERIYIQCGLKNIFGIVEIHEMQRGGHRRVFSSIPLSVISHPTKESSVDRLVSGIFC
jgi:hypothetical protein